jgi:hypothetical protein
MPGPRSLIEDAVLGAPGDSGSAKRQERACYIVPHLFLNEAWAREWARKYNGPRSLIAV